MCGLRLHELDLRLAASTSLLTKPASCASAAISASVHLPAPPPPPLPPPEEEEEASRHEEIVRRTMGFPDDEPDKVAAPSGSRPASLRPQTANPSYAWTSTRDLLSRIQSQVYSQATNTSTHSFLESTPAPPQGTPDERS